MKQLQKCSSCQSPRNNNENSRYKLLSFNLYFENEYLFDQVYSFKTGPLHWRDPVGIMLFSQQYQSKNEPIMVLGCSQQ